MTCLLKVLLSNSYVKQIQDVPSLFPQGLRVEIDEQARTAAHEQILCFGGTDTVIRSVSHVHVTFDFIF